MKYIKLIILALLLQYSFSGCSYVSDMVEGKITKRASFSIDAKQVGNNVVITWTKTDNSAPDGFAGIEIYRTRDANDEYSGYETISDRWEDGTLASGTIGTYTHVGANATKGVYFYRVGFIHWDKPVAERTTDNGYTGSTTTDYNNHTDIDEISGSARVSIN